MATGGQAGKTPRMRRHAPVGGLQGAHKKTRIGLGRSKQGNTKGSQRVGSGRAKVGQAGAPSRRFKLNTKGSSR